MGSAGYTGLVIALAYLLAAVLFIVGLKRLSSPRTARSGNLLGAAGMFIAVVATLLHQDIVDFTWILAAVVVGSAAGAILARKVKMTAMPQMVGLLNGFGGGASALVAAAEYLRIAAGEPASMDVLVTIMLSMLIGGVTFAGSLIAFGKLQGLVSGRPVTLPLQRAIYGLLVAASVFLAAVLIAGDPDLALFTALTAAALAVGILMVLPIGGADMPVVIALLNAFSGLAASMTGFVLHNNLLIIAGALVGASGLILTRIMCAAMNRSLTNVLFGAVGGADGDDGAVAGGAADGRVVREVTADDAAVLLSYSRSVIFVPGYGMADRKSVV